MFEGSGGSATAAKEYTKKSSLSEAVLSRRFTWDSAYEARMIRGVDRLTWIAHQQLAHQAAGPHRL